MARDSSNEARLSSKEMPYEKQDMAENKLERETPRTWLSLNHGGYGEARIVHVVLTMRKWISFFINFKKLCTSDHD